MNQPECPHDVTEKYVTRHGLACRECLTEADLAKYPGWKERLEAHDCRVKIARVNFRLEP